MDKYGKTNEELELEKRQQCRDIVREIKNFGVNQEQYLLLIKLLALELEDASMMRNITNTIKNAVEPGIITKGSIEV